uniref:Uncharacterized protein n=1 Tax=Beihai levi-like virus 33 TaxID=1922419 RepID=A0A1L3KIF9_9VIRU|nr:hypothetical protein [Beihai levi-like virus 33]
MAIMTKDGLNQDVVYEPYRIEGNRAEYIGPKHSDVDKEMMVITSAAPKRTASSYGNRRSQVNVIHTVEVETPENAGKVQRDAKIEALASVPVGMTFEEFKDLGHALANVLMNETYLEEIFVAGKIQQ